MDLSHKHPLMRLLCAEPLEGRWLLSGTAPTDSTQAAPAATISWTQPEKVSEDDDEEEEVIAEADLPGLVLKAFNVNFPGQKIEEATLENDDERGAEYDITTGDGEVEVTISPSGQIVETETTIKTSELPQDVVDDFQAKHPGAQITEAADLGNGQYDLEYRFGGDDYEIEATRSEPTPSPASPPAEETPSQPAPLLAPAPVADASMPVASSAAADPIVDAAPAESPEAQQVAQADAAKTDAERRAREDAIERNAVAKAAAATTMPDDRVVRALDALAAGAAAGVWLPDVAGALIDVLPVNVDAIEQRMQDVLRQFATVGGNVKAASSPLTTGASRLAMAATLVAAVKMLLNHSKKPTTTGGTLVFGSGRSSWGWVLGTTGRNRKRVTSVQARKS